jgi:uncharacterized membrane protein YkoI
MKTTVAVAVLALFVATPMLAQDIKVKEEKPGLLAKAKVTAAAAMASAQAKVPKGKIVSAEIEEEKGKLIYSFDIKTDGKSGTDEVNVDAMTGAVGAVEHEDAAAEKKEAAAEKAKAAKKP